MNRRTRAQRDEEREPYSQPQHLSLRNSDKRRARDTFQNASGVVHGHVERHEDRRFEARRQRLDIRLRLLVRVFDGKRSPPDSRNAIAHQQEIERSLALPVTSVFAPFNGCYETCRLIVLSLCLRADQGASVTGNHQFLVSRDDPHADPARGRADA